MRGSAALNQIEWKACREKHPDYIGGSARDEAGEGPFNHRDAGLMARSFREYLQPELPGADETEKSNSVFAKAPAWLRWFTHADIHAQILGLNVQDLSSKSQVERPGICSHFTKGPFGWLRLPDGAEDEFYATTRERLVPII